MYKCKHCKAIFEEPKEIHTTYEIEFGIANDVSGSTPLTISSCPYCGCGKYEEFYGDVEDEEELEDE